MRTAAIVFAFAISAGVALWAAWMLADWLARGRPDRFTVDEIARRWNGE